LHLPKFNQNGFSIQQLQSSSKIQVDWTWRIFPISNLSNLNLNPAAFCDLLGKVPLLLCRNLAFMNFANPVMILCLTWNFNMLTTPCHHYSLIIFYWSLIEDYSVLVAFTSEFYFAYCGVLFFENSVVSKRAHFQRNCIII